MSRESVHIYKAQEAYLPHFEGPKVLYPEFCNVPQFQMENGHFTNNKCYFIGSTDAWLAAFLNSKVSWFTITGNGVPVRGGFHQMHSQFVERAVLPEMNPAEEGRLAELAGGCQKAAQSRLMLQTNLIRRIPDLCPPERAPKLSTKLKKWWTLPDFASFRTEVKKAFKADIPLSERSDWEDWITRDRAEIARLTAEIERAEAEIDTIVYDLFDLTPDEIALLEAAI